MNKEWLYPESIEAAIKAQAEMRAAVCVEDRIENLKFLGGMDVSCMRFDPKKRIYASSVVLSGATLLVAECASIEKVHEFPYIPGLLGFREAPSLIHAYQKLTLKPDVIMVDGQGTCHPRGLGIASHIGVVLDCPTIGVAKSILIGKPEGALGYSAGSTTPLVWRGEVVGMAVRTKDGCKPLIISPGHKISLATSVELVLKACKGYRLPEPTRQAHLAANAYRRELTS